ncbi:hypothetical protein KP509_05G069900 [Ceratopteris richardii]|uniref:Uncharacterized protein n=1 Tax=Ceratopteris richardii TaxID=49495 RepID=A0A8T2R014_CERRI|nr:hypothetical protein KP509_30G015000 [Ceratopteris richardii]KAH7437412.1 hypothetical protein KP509_05G069900 [Ceratopteris richardii]
MCAQRHKKKTEESFTDNYIIRTLLLSRRAMIIHQRSAHSPIASSNNVSDHKFDFLQTDRRMLLNLQRRRKIEEEIEALTGKFSDHYLKYSVVLFYKSDVLYWRLILRND